MMVVAVSTNPSAVFDPFSVSPGAEPIPAAQQAEQEAFSNFSPPQPTAQDTFASFSSPQPAVQDAFASFSSPQPAAQGTFAHFSSPPPGGAIGTNASAAMHAPQVNYMAQQYPNAQAAVMQPTNTATSFENFQGPSSQAQTKKNTVNQSNIRTTRDSNDAWGAGSSLFDLSDLKSDSCATNMMGSNPQHHGYSQNSFSGLDTLAGMPSKAPQNRSIGMPQPMNAMQPMGQQFMGTPTPSTGYSGQANPSQYQYQMRESHGAQMMGQGAQRSMAYPQNMGMQTQGGGMHPMQQQSMMGQANMPTSQQQQQQQFSFNNRMGNPF